MSKPIVVALDHAKIGTLLDFTVERGLPMEQRRNKVFAVLDAALASNDKILLVPSVQDSELGDNIADEFLEDFNEWLQKETYKNRVLKAEKVKHEKDKKRFDPDNKRGSERGGAEQWDMDVRRFMWENRKHYDFVVVSADKDFLKNSFSADTDLGRLQFERVSFKSLMISLLTHPGVSLTRKQHDRIVKTASPNGGGFGQFSSLEKHHPEIQESYEAAIKLKEEARQTNVLEDRQKGKTNRTRAAKKGGKLLDLGAPIMITGAAAFAMNKMIMSEAEESGLSYQEAAQALGIEITREKLKDLAEEAGLDLAVTLTPIGPLKKAWDVLGNIDDIVSLMQLYGAAYPENETIQQMAAIADELADSAALAAYVEGRDALTGAIGGAIDFVLGNAESEEEAAEAIGKVRSAIREGSEELGEAAAKGASREELTDLLIRRAGTSEPAPLAEPDFSAPDMSSGPLLEGEAPLSGAPGDEGPSGEAEGPAQGTGFNGEAPAGSEFIGKTGLSFSPAAGDAAQAAPGVDPYARKTSYDRDRKLGRTPEEEAEALAEFEDLLREAYVVTGNMPMAHGMASAQLKVEWGSSVFAAEEGTVMKYPVEKAYVDPEKDGHGYVRSDVEALLTSAGIKARRWYLEPNAKTAGDRFRGSMDEDGYGPRMTPGYGPINETEMACEIATSR